MPTSAAISRARVKLGPAPLKALFAEVARPLATESTPGARYRGWRLVAVDGTVFDVPDSTENAEYFGRPKTHRTERCAYPQVRMVALAECGTHAITAAALGPFKTAEPVLARQLFGHLGVGICCWPTEASPMCSCGGQRAPVARICCGASDLHLILPVRQELADGSYLSEIVEAKDHRKRLDPTIVRVIEYTLDGPGFPVQEAPYRLITTILDPDAAPATDLRHCITSGGRSKPRSMNSRPTSADPRRCCGRVHPRVSSRRSGATCWSITPSAP
ncbi:hypothetical protein ACQP1G_21295 [Nocardia sp. CA-107356]|uniref:hypothetical protein n=1 Tax=Nocardia sp. CA-107356 TaxID=3239972 RepID=UPI003D8E3C44